MAEQQGDPRAIRSRQALLRAVGELLVSEDVERISVTQVVAVAGVTRPTFYQHYADVAELARDAAIERLGAELERHAPAPAMGSAIGAEEWLAILEPVVRELLEHLAVHRDFYRRVFTGPSATQVFDAAVELLVRRILTYSPLGAAIAAVDSEEARDRVTILAGGLVWFISNWLRTDLAGADEIAAMARRASVQLVQLARAGS